MGHDGRCYCCCCCCCYFGLCWAVCMTVCEVVCVIVTSCDLCMLNESGLADLFFNTHKMWIFALHDVHNSPIKMCNNMYILIFCICVWYVLVPLAHQWWPECVEHRPRWACAGCGCCTGWAPDLARSVDSPAASYGRDEKTGSSTSLQRKKKEKDYLLLQSQGQSHWNVVII